MCKSNPVLVHLKLGQQWMIIIKNNNNNNKEPPVFPPQLCCFSVRNTYPKLAREWLGRLCSTPLPSQGTAPCGHRVIWVSQEAPSTESSVQLRESVNSRAFSRTAPQAFCGNERPLLPQALTCLSTLGLFGASAAPAPAVSSPGPPDCRITSSLR